ncbi:MAG TPA: hypothetical protein VI457_10710 [Methylococcaceae bacterium]|nr:hypothetical protein [Methylococcaceae bacterium]
MKFPNRTHLLGAARPIALSVAILAALSSPAQAAAGGGGGAAGKPFVQLQNEIIEVQNVVTQTFEEQVTNLTQVVMTSDTALEGRVSALETQVSSLESRLSGVEDEIEAMNITLDDLKSRIGTTETNIGLLQIKSGNQQNQIDDLIASALQQGVDILALEAQLAGVNQQIMVLQTTTGDHTAEISDLQLQATSLKSQIETNAAGITTLRTDLTNTKNLIGALQTQLSQMQNSLQQLQNAMNYSCAPGTVLSQIDRTTYTCKGLHTTIVAHGKTLGSAKWGYLTGAECPAGTVLTGAGWWSYSYHVPHHFHANTANPNVWEMGSVVVDTYWMYLNCLNIE